MLSVYPKKVHADFTLQDNLIEVDIDLIYSVSLLVIVSSGF